MRTNEQIAEALEQVVIDHDSYAIGFDDMKRLLDFYSYGDSHRIAFLILAITGCRPAELTYMSPKCFIGNYIIWKPAKRQGGYRKELMPEWALKEIDYYMSRNHLPENRLFPFVGDSLRRHFNKIARPALGGNFTKKVLRNMNNHVQFHYMIDLKSFRHTFAVKEFWEKMKEYGNDMAIAMVSKRMKHSGGSTFITAKHYVSDVEYMKQELERYNQRSIGQVLKQPVQLRLTQFGLMPPMGQSRVTNF